MAALVPVPPAVGGRSRRGCGPPSRRAPGRSTSVICGPPRRPAPTCAAFRSCAAHRSRADGYGVSPCHWRQRPPRPPPPWATSPSPRTAPSSRTPRPPRPRAPYRRAPPLPRPPQPSSHPQRLHRAPQHPAYSIRRHAVPHHPLRPFRPRSSARRPVPGPAARGHRIALRCARPPRSGRDRPGARAVHRAGPLTARAGGAAYHPRRPFPPGATSRTSFVSKFVRNSPPPHNSRALRNSALFAVPTGIAARRRPPARSGFRNPPSAHFRPSSGVRCATFPRRRPPAPGRGHPPPTVAARVARHPPYPAPAPASRAPRSGIATLCRLRTPSAWLRPEPVAR